jgi:hypothetical protein
LKLKGEKFDIKINNSKYEFDEQTESSFIIGDDYKVNLTKASSGLQSYIPLLLVSNKLSKAVKNSDKDLITSVSVKQKIARQNKLNNLLADPNISKEELERQREKAESGYMPKCFVNIVEEPEQNLFPSSQREMLNSLLEFNNMNEGNKLIMTTHSPYLLVYITLCVEANKLKLKVKTDDLKTKLSDIVPLQSTIEGDDLVVYQLDEKTGTIEKLKNYKGLPSDENKLNDGLAEANEEFSKLLDLEDLCQ